MSWLKSRSSQRWLVLALLVVLALGVAGWSLWPRAPRLPAWEADYDLNARPPELIAPGTVIDRSAPPGWSHLIMKSHPRVRKQDQAALNSLTVRMAAWLFTAFVADVQESTGPGPRYRLRAVGLGMGTTVNGKDVIIDPDTADQHGVELNFITRTILERAYVVQKRAVMPLHGPTFGLLDTPVYYHCRGKNRPVRYRYALLVDGATGRLDVLMSVLDVEAACGESSVVVIAPNTIDEAELIPDVDKFVAGLPTSQSDDVFGVEGFPPHRAKFQFRPALRELATKTIFTADEARDLEAGLRQQLADLPPP